MIRLLIFFCLIWTQVSWAIHCDCEVLVYSPISGSHQLKPTTLKTFVLEEFDSMRAKNQRQCRKSCEEKFNDDLPAERLTALLISISRELIHEKVVGYNCTGLTTLKYPVRVKARLGNVSLGNVADEIHVVSHEELCFF